MFQNTAHKFYFVFHLKKIKKIEEETLRVRKRTLDSLYIKKSLKTLCEENNSHPQNKHFSLDFLMLSKRKGCCQTHAPMLLNLRHVNFPRGSAKNIGRHFSHVFNSCKNREILHPIRNYAKVAFFFRFFTLLSLPQKKKKQ